MIRRVVAGLLRAAGRTRFKGYTLLTQKYKPMLQLLCELEQRGVDTAALDALEMFGRDGLDHTTTYAGHVKSLEVWEIDAKHQPRLQTNLPGASVRIVDSFAEVVQTARRFDLIVVDNHIGLYGNHCDHFGLFPANIFMIARDPCVLVLNVIPRIDRRVLGQFPWLASVDYLERRQQFYAASDARNIPRGQIVDTYRSLVEQSGFRLEWSFHVKRYSVGTEYLVLFIRR